MSPGCDDPETYEYLRPLLEKWAAKTKDGESCVLRIGPGGSGNCTFTNRIESLLLVQVSVLGYFVLGAWFLVLGDSRCS